MKALVVKQPYADQIVRGIKDVENRSWNTEHRGTVAIIAGQKVATDSAKTLPRGVVVGMVQLAAVTEHDPKARVSPHENGERYVWHLTDPVLLAEPFPVRGRERLFDLAQRDVAKLAMARKLDPDSLDQRVVVA